jgi:ABC-type multidrug transport system ATPase subunit
MSAPATNPANAAVLSVQNLHFSWPQGPLFTGLSFELPAGVSQVVGDDGSGKTTLLKLLAGALAPSGGQLAIHGAPLDPRTKERQKQVFWVDPQTDALDAVSAAAYLDALAQRYPHTRTDLLGDVVAGFGLQPHLDKPLYMLSAGSKRKVWLSAAFAAGAPLTLMDHPFAALDSPSIRFLRELLQDAAGHSERAWLLADHTAPDGMALAQLIQL